MQLRYNFIIHVVCLFVMTSFAMKSQKYVQMTSSTGAYVCSTDPPSQVLPMLPGGETRCGTECVTSSACPYYQFKTTNSIQCELYSQFPANFKSIDNCIGFRSPSILPRDCTDIWNFFGIKLSGVYSVFVGNKNRSMTVYCDMSTTSGGWTVFQRRRDGSVNFYRNWISYTQEFGDANGEFWIGYYTSFSLCMVLAYDSVRSILDEDCGNTGHSQVNCNDNLNLLTTTRRYKLRVDLADFNGNTAYAEYDNFVVQSATDKYSLSSLGTYNGTAGDSLSYQLGQRFSTYDQDNDATTGNCAVSYKGAWWYSNCHYSNLNGFYYGGPHSSYGDGVEWFTWTGQKYSLKITEMKIKPL